MDLTHDLDLLLHAARATVRRHEVIASNIANVNTPNYRARELRFDDAFREALRRGDTESAMKVRGEVVESETAVVKPDGNSVDLERELGRMQKNALLNSVYTSVLNAKLKQLRLAIQSGGA